MTKRLFAGLALLLLLAWPAAAQQDLVNLSALVSPASIAPGQSATLTLRVKVADKYHINSNDPDTDFIPTELEVSQADGLVMSDPVYPKPHLKKVEFAPQPVELFDGSFDIVVQVRAQKGAKPGKRTLTLSLNYQACDDQMCLMPSVAEAQAELEVK